MCCALCPLNFQWELVWSVVAFTFRWAHLAQVKLCVHGTTRGKGAQNHLFFSRLPPPPSPSFF